MGLITTYNSSLKSLAKSAGAVLYLDARKATGNSGPINSPLTNPWRDLSGVQDAYNNLITAPAMDKDTNTDGVVDGFASLNNFGASGIYSLNDNAQKITLVNGNINSAFIRISQGGNTDPYVLACAPNDIFSASVECKYTKTAGNPKAVLQVIYRTSAGSYISGFNADISVTTTGYQRFVIENALAPANSAYVQLLLQITTSATASTTPESAEAWFKNALLVKRPVAEAGTFGNDAFSTNFAGTTASGVDVSDPSKPFWAMDGTDDFFSLVNTPSVDITTAPLAVFATVKVSVGATGSYIICKNLDSSINIQYAINFDSANMQFTLWLEGSGRKSTGNGSVAFDTWYNIGYVWDGTNIYQYLNSVLIGSPTAFSGTLTARANVSIGRRYAGSYFKGLIATASIYSGAKVTTANVLKAERAISKAYIGG